ncbi:uncharacterized protein LOC129303198 [Prosopis cineraria]|uniref:uncharacterized protein LOC129303198 n=1 Tax=Prosopis cineraria TaxID=364024 RepID=UPI00241009ED|nr:uncharacterized protein LOC129303198 [Prosopis cineraria]
MEIDLCDTKPTVEIPRERLGKDRVRPRRETLLAAFEQCRRSLELLNMTSVVDEVEKDFGIEVEPTGSDRRLEGSPSTRDDQDADELRDLLKSRFECPAFLEKLQCAQASDSWNTIEEGNSWDMVSEDDLWKGEDIESDQEGYVLVRQEDIAEGMACFMAACLLSLDHTKLQDMTPNQLQKVLRKTFSVKKKKGKLQKAWDGSKVIYNVASWGATAIGIYQNPVIIEAATKALWTSCHVISKLL